MRSGSSSNPKYHVPLACPLPTGPSVLAVVDHATTATTSTTTKRGGGGGGGGGGQEQPEKDRSDADAPQAQRDADDVCSRVAHHALAARNSPTRFCGSSSSGSGSSNTGSNSNSNSPKRGRTFFVRVRLLRAHNIISVVVEKEDRRETWWLLLRQQPHQLPARRREGSLLACSSHHKCPRKRIRWDRRHRGSLDKKSTTAATAAAAAVAAAACVFARGCEGFVLTRWLLQR